MTHQNGDSETENISGVFRSARGADMFCRIYGYISTCRILFPTFEAIKAALDGKPFVPEALAWSFSVFKEQLNSKQGEQLRKEL